MSPAVG